MFVQYFISLFIIELFVCIVWLWYLKTQNPTVIDVGWAFGIFIGASSHILLQWPINKLTLTHSILLFLVFVWALRLGGYLWYTRVHQKKIDPRYQSLSDGWSLPKKYGFLLNYLLQGFLMSLIATPFLIIGSYENASVNFFTIIGCLLVILGIMGESTADWQLSRFKKNNKTSLCDVGLWKYSRHPNYFFDWLAWTGFCVVGLSMPNGYIGLLSPISLFIIMWFITIPITEQHSLQKRVEYAEYQKGTSKFFIWFKQ